MSTKIKCLLLDDELPGLAYLKMLCEQIDTLEVVKAFNDPALFLEQAPGIEYDLLISDIEMPGINGLQIADAVKGKAIIFTTAYKNFAADAFDRDVADYIVKPVKPERLQQAIGKVMLRNTLKMPKRVQVQLNTDRGRAIIDADKILCILPSEIDSRDKVVILNDNTTFTVKNISFEKLLQELPQARFCRINKKAVLSIKHVKFFSNNEIISDVISSNGRPYTFALSDIYRNDFLDKLNT